MSVSRIAIPESLSALQDIEMGKTLKDEVLQLEKGLKESPSSEKLLKHSRKQFRSMENHLSITKHVLQQADCGLDV